MIQILTAQGLGSG